MTTIHFWPDDIKVETEPGQSLLEAARAAGVPLESPCNGTGVCGKCRVVVLAGDLQPGPDDHPSSAVHQLPAPQVLACRQLVGQLEAVINIPRAATGLQVHDQGDSINYALAPRWAKRYDRVGRSTEVLAGGRIITRESGDTSSGLLGLAVDIGTTTLAVSLINLRDGAELASATGLNPQTGLAQDVLGRVHFASEDGGLTRLQQTVVQAINQLAGQVAAQAGRDLNQVYELVVSGNTCMIHLAAGRNPAALGRHPFSPEFRGHALFQAGELGLAGADCAEVYFPPVISGHVGADIVAGLAATGLEERPGVSLFVDIGTNGEMVLAQDGRLLAASTAAGPAFEGMNISCGMRAAPGAIESYHLEKTGELTVKTIGRARAIGLCGSGLMDVVAELVSHGGLTAGGRFTPGGGRLAEWLERDGGKTRLRLAEGIYLTQKDIRQVQAAKAAIRAGIRLLLDEAGLRPDQVERVLVAGSFGYHLREAALLALGLLPPEFAGLVTMVGNTSKSGARLFLLNEPGRAEAAGLAGRVRHFNLADKPRFQEVFVAAMAFPLPGRS
ncbi:MAG: ASKHA domain-containing protein [Candidatus Adiutrix sp.]|jgi:uncharacterized 2Fe-2S/4Fe-4S cluster protein (DUF4445 family)|nr:ASKHA domain-containing protein [Candidatus Adiutrix sp.]